MRSHTLVAAALMVVSMGTMACAAESTSPTPTAGAGEGKGESALTITTNTDGKLSGSFKFAADTLQFEVTRDADQVYSTTLKTRGLTLDATFTKGAVSFDGFASEGGGDTQLTKDDRPVLVAFEKALHTELAQLVKDGNKEADLVTHVALSWADWPSSLKLTRRVLAEEGRSWTSLCSKMYTWVTATHNCSSPGFNNWQANSSVYASIGNYGGAGANTQYWNGNAYTTAAYDHASWPWEYGDCYGRCGIDCGSSTTYTQDCVNHDSCVRNGHAVASLYCDDEFSYTLDDALATWLGGAPNC